MHLTFRKLSLFFKIPTLASLMQISWPLFAFCITPFLTWSTTSSSLLTSTWKSQALHRTNSNAVFSLLTPTGANKTTPLHVGTSYTHHIGFHSKRNVSATHQIVWSLNLPIARELCLIRISINRGTTPLYNSPLLDIYCKGRPSTFSWAYSWHQLQTFGVLWMLGTHSGLCRGQMSQIWHQSSKG